MKLKSITLAALLPIAAYSQKVDLDRFSITVSVRQLPTAVKDTNYKTYSVECSSYADFNRSSVPLNADRLEIDGLKKLGSGGHYVAKVKFLSGRLEATGVDDIPHIEKNKEGAIVKETHTYKPYIEYSVSFGTELYDYKGTKLDVMSTNATSGSSSQNRKFYPAGNDREFNTYSDASNYYRNNSSSIANDVVNREFSKHLEASRSKLNSLIGWSVISWKDDLWINDAKKHPEFDKQQAIIAEFKTWSTQISGGRALSEDEVKKANEFLDYFESLKKKYPTDEKADKKLRYSAFYNKAIIYLYYLDNPTKAYDEGAGLIANEYDEKDGKSLQTKADNLKASLDRTKKKSRHFDIDLSDVKGPNE